MSFELQRGSILGHYELLVRIGRGGMASVWVARGRPDPKGPEQLVAIKAMLPDLAQNVEFRSMFLDEGQICRSIDHPNVVRVFEVGEAYGSLYMAMEWVEGDSLHALIAEANKRRPIPPEVAVRMIADTAAGLHAAHEVKGWDGELQGIVHCDVSPHNILIGLNGPVKLVDFGVAGAMSQITDDDEAKIRGKFGYMSPEQAQAKPLDRRSDVFSLGIVLFELTTGYRLFRGRDDRHTLDLVNWGKIPRPSQVVKSYPSKLEAIVMRALERDIDKRFQTADELRDALETYLVEERILVPSAGVKGLLRRVLGTRIDQRRQQIRAAIRALDGSHPGVTLVSDDSVLEDAEPISVSVSQVEPIGAGDLSSPSGLGAAWLPSDSSAGAHSVSQPSAPPRRASSLGFLIGAAVGIIGAAAAFVIVSNRDSEPEVKEFNPKPPTASGASGSDRIAVAPQPENASELKQGYSIDSLPEEGEGVLPIPMQGTGTRSPRTTNEREPQKDGQLVDDMEALRANPERTKVVLEEDRVSDIANSVTLGDDKKARREQPAGGIDRNAASAALSRAASLTGMCRRVGGQTGTGRVLVTIKPNGSVAGVQVQPPFAGTAVGNCVAGQFQRVSVPSFDGDTVTLSKSFTIPD